MVTELTFTFNEFKYKEGMFKVDNLTVIDTLDNYNVDYDNIELYLDGKPYAGDINTWSTNGVTVDYIFDEVVSAYLRNDTYDYSNFGSEWEAFDLLKNMGKVEDGIVTVLPVYSCGEVELYDLDLATPELRYYCGNDSYLLLRDNGEVVTDMEHFYTEGMIEDLCDILKGDVECVYMGYNPKEFIKEMGGEEAFLEEFDE